MPALAAVASRRDSEPHQDARGAQQREGALRRRRVRRVRPLPFWRFRSAPKPGRESATAVTPRHRSVQVLGGGLSHLRRAVHADLPVALQARVRALFPRTDILRLCAHIGRATVTDRSESPRAIVTRRRNKKLLGIPPETDDEDADLGVLGIAAALSSAMANCCTAVVEVPIDTARQQLQARAGSPLIHVL